MVVVTGAAGHIGTNLVRALLAAGRPVRAVVRRSTRGLAGLPVELVHADVLDPPSLDRALAGAEVVHHCAGRVSLHGDPGGLVHRVNVEGVANVARAALRAGVRRVVHYSSVHAFDLLGPVLDEAAPRPGPGHPAYDRSKAAGEAALDAVVAEGLDAVVLNPAAVLGPTDPEPSRAGRTLLDIRDGRLPAMVPGGFQWVDVRDLCHTALRAETAGRTGERYLVGGHWASMPDLVDLAARLSGARPPRLVVPMALARLGAPLVGAWARLRGTEPIFTGEALRALGEPAPGPCWDKARAELGHAPRPLERTIADFYAWAAAEGL